MFVVHTLGASFPDGSVVKTLPANAGDRGSTDYIQYIKYVIYNIYMQGQFSSVQLFSRV